MELEKRIAEMEKKLAEEQSAAERHLSYMNGQLGMLKQLLAEQNAPEPEPTADNDSND